MTLNAQMEFKCPSSFKFLSVENSIVINYDSTSSLVWLTKNFTHLTEALGRCFLEIKATFKAVPRFQRI